MTLLEWTAQAVEEIVRTDDIRELRAVVDAMMAFSEFRSLAIPELLLPLVRESDEDLRSVASIIASVANTRVKELEGYRQGPDLAPLSAVQREILSWIAKGKTNSEIAVITGRTKRSTDYQVIEILKKMEITSRAQAAAAFSVR